MDKQKRYSWIGCVSCDLDEVWEDTEGPQGCSARLQRWRPPTTEEIEGLVARQMARAQGRRAEKPPTGKEVWTFTGAQV